jgi:hypothetical protein
MDFKAMLQRRLTDFLSQEPETPKGKIVSDQVGVRFGYPGGLHEPTSCWSYQPKGAPDVQMIFDFYKNFSDHDLICKVTRVGEDVRTGAGASIQFNANYFKPDVDGNVVFLHRGLVNAGGSISREALLAGFARLARPAFEELGGEPFFSSWPIQLGTTAGLDLMVDNIFLYVYAVEQVKREKRGEVPLPAWSRAARRRYWFTVHWPPEKGQQRDFGVFLAEGTQTAGRKIGPGDYVWVYESKGGRAKLRTGADGAGRPVGYEEGKRGVVGLSQVKAPLSRLDVTKDFYSDGSSKLWNWYVDAKPLRMSGFVPLKRVNEILDYKPNYGMRGFGNKTGLREINESTHFALLEAYRAGTVPLPKVGQPKGGGRGGEGPIHKALKERIAADPAGLLGEVGLEHVATEFPFVTGDRADIILEDGVGRHIGLEVEVEVTMRDLSGVLQALKYRVMYGLVADRPDSEGRSFLVAHRIDDDVRALCAKHGVECFEVA